MTQKNSSLILIFLFFAFGVAGQWAPQSNFPGGSRDDGYGVGVNEIIYVGGGRGADFGFRSDFWKFNGVDWARLKDSPFTARQYAQMAAFGDSVWVAGGLQQSEYFSDVWLYRPSLDQWSFHSHLPHPVRQGVLFAPNGELVVGLGEKAPDMLSDSLYIFRDGEWHPLTPVPNGGRFRCGYFSVGQRLYLGWGRDSSGVHFNDWQVYDLLSGEWDTLSPPPGAPREWCSSTSNFNGSGVVGFGMDSAGDFLKDVFYFNPILNSFQKIDEYSTLLRGAVLAGSDEELHLITGLSGDFDRLDIHEIYTRAGSENERLLIFPNPARNYVHIRYLPAISSNWKITDVNGKIVQEKQCKSGSCEFSLLGIQSGMYFISNGTLTTKLLIN
ncbi:MAG: T9SS type A sorting domain-containing protein [Cryomorphaceae bacterium]|nr:T9SS type A sorting domain-containing protein [Cryomorphaceae bacterium]